MDQAWQRTFTWVWVGFAGVCVILAFPALVRSMVTLRLFKGYFIAESLDGRRRREVQTVSRPGGPRKLSRSRRVHARICAVVQSTALATSPLPAFLSKGADCCRKSYLPISLGQLIIVLGYIGAVVACLVKDAQLSTNSNRAGQYHFA